MNRIVYYSIWDWLFFVVLSDSDAKMKRNKIKWIGHANDFQQ